MSFTYSPESRRLQDRFDTRRLADRLAEVKVHHAFTEADREFIAARDMFFLATVDDQGQPSCSYKGGEPGFVKVLDETTLAFPSWDGNGMYVSMGNIGGSGGVGMLFIDFEAQRRMRVDGVAEVVLDHPLLGAWPGAQLVVLVHARSIYPNCSRYIHRYRLEERSSFVPRASASASPPVPEWKRAEWARDVLPAGDPAGAAPPP